MGGGPAGLAVLLAAHKDGRFKEMLSQGLLIVERGAQIGPGQIGTYSINSDSTGDTFIDPLRAGTEARLHAILDTPVARRAAAAGLDSIPLRDAGELMTLVGEALHSLIGDYPQSAVLTHCTATLAQQQCDGTWQVSLTDAEGKLQHVQGKSLILATGATQPLARLQRETVAGVPVAARWGNRLMQSGEVFGQGGLEKVASLLAGKTDPKVAILGGSTSAMAIAHALLHRMPAVRFGEGGLTLFHRRPMRVYYTNAEEALQDGYTEFGPDDLCPITKRVYRFAGLRLDSRELLMQVRGIGNRPPEPRMKMHQLQPQDPEAVRRIDAVDLVIAALGYRPNALPILDERDEAVSLFAHTGPSAALVDDKCRVLDNQGTPIAGLYGIGLAAGFIPRGSLGGEPSFSGQANGLWLWQHDVGSIIVKAVLPERSERHEPPAPFTAPPARQAPMRVANQPSGPRASLPTGTRA